MRRIMIACLVVVTSCCGLTLATAEPAVVLARQGRPAVKIFVAAPDGKAESLGYAAPAVADLQRVLKKMTGGEFQCEIGPLPKALEPGLYVGRLQDFAATDVGASLPKSLEDQEFIIRTTDRGQVLLVGGGEWGVSHAIYEMLYELGCRWYFPRRSGRSCRSWTRRP